ncbi:MAG: outer membrane beta-barrel protein [Nitrospirae bacterium]|nr:outer membrane beta-barrel protein [Nitrospirota bacterium]
MSYLKIQTVSDKKRFSLAIMLRMTEGVRRRLLSGQAIFLFLVCLLSVSPVLAEPAAQTEILSLTVQKNSTLDDLIVASGYGIDDENLETFLSEFMNLNPDIAYLSSLAQGTVVKIPVVHLKKINRDQPVIVGNNLPDGNPVAAESGAPPDLPTGNATAAEQAEKLEMGRFSNMDTAKAFLLKLIESGYTGGIEQQKNSNGQEEYKVYVLLSSAPGAEAGSESLTWSLLGQKGKSIHAAVTLTGIFTDNAFNTKENRKSDFSLLLTPEVWLNLPRTDKAADYENLSPRSTGGHVLDSLPGERLFGYQVSLYYRTDLPLIASKTSPYGSTATHKVAAGLALIGNRFSLNVSDQFEKAYQEREAGQVIRTDTRERYDANRFSAGVAYDTRNRFIFSLDYVNFITGYRSEIGEGLDRHDYGFTPTLRYRLTSKINLLAEYTYSVVSYDSNSSLDSKEQYFLGGLEWRLTEKSFGRVKAGYEVKDFIHGERYSGYSFELQLEQRLTPKTQFALAAYRKTNEMRVAGTAFTITTGARLSLSHMLTSKITTAFLLSYQNDRHKGTSLLSLSETAVNDDIYQAGVEVQYAFRRWLRARAEYFFTIKESSDPAFDYRSNTLLLGLTGAF